VLGHAVEEGDHAAQPQAQGQERDLLRGQVGHRSVAAHKRLDPFPVLVVLLGCGRPPYVSGQACFRKRDNTNQSREGGHNRYANR
jgi:hypothetical protein